MQSSQNPWRRRAFKNAYTFSGLVNRYSTTTCVPLRSSRERCSMRSSMRLRTPFRNSTCAFLKCPRPASDQRCSIIGKTAQKKQPGCGAPALAVFSSSIFSSPSFPRSEFYSPTLRGPAKGRPSRPAGRCAAEQAHLALDGERQPQTDFVASVALGKRVRRLRAAHCRGVLLLAVHRGGQFLQAVAAQHFMREQRHALDRRRREVRLDFLKNPLLRRPPFLEPGVFHRRRKHAVDDDAIHCESV